MTFTFFHQVFDFRPFEIRMTMAFAEAVDGKLDTLLLDNVAATVNEIVEHNLPSWFMRWKYMAPPAGDGTDDVRVLWTGSFRDRVRSLLVRTQTRISSGLRHNQLVELDCKLSFLDAWRRYATGARTARPPMVFQMQ